MTGSYQPADIESKWRQKWEADGLYRVHDNDPRPKWYELTMYPYPSGDLHIGHWYAMSPYDAHVRFKRMRGYNVLAPMGFDAFGLPAENAAIKRGIHPYTWTMGNIERMRGQLKSMGAAFDWSREIICCLPEYYRWNQWFFLKFLQAGLAYKTKAPANWCPTDQTVLANEQVVNGRCERCDSIVERRDLEQWFFRITKYADELLDFSGLVDWPEKIKIMQRHWIGRSTGVELSFDIAHYGLDRREIKVFTTRADTVFGVTFLVLAPEHPLVQQLTTPDRKAEVDAYVSQARRATEVERMSTDRPKTGVYIGAHCVNPFNGERVPLYIADYVLGSYGTGAVMAVPAHDERDFDFAKKHGLPINVVVSPPGWDGGELHEAYTGMGALVHSGAFDGTPSERAIDAIADFAETRGIGKRTISYRVRDWLVSRQRYWGTPIPIIYCPDHGAVPVPEAELPVLLPQDAEFRPTGQSPLKYNDAFLHTTCPVCGKPAVRETDTLDTFVDSSWYYLRYLSPHYGGAPFDPSQAQWLPPDQYTGGAEHAVMHLLYARFFTKALRDLGVVNFSEPFPRLFNQGIILGEDHDKMSKSRGNVVNPDEFVNSLGADAVRLFLMFIGPWEQGGSWSTTGIQGVSRWLNRVWVIGTRDAAEMGPTSQSSPADGEGGRSAPSQPLPPSLTLSIPVERVAPSAARGEVGSGGGGQRGLNQSLHPSAGESEDGGTPNSDDLVRATHKAIKKVTADLERFSFNTCVAALMELTNSMNRAWDARAATPEAWRDSVRALLLMLAPMAPHVTEELWMRNGLPYSIHNQAWPAWDEALAQDVAIILVVQVNGKVRDRIGVPAGIQEAEARDLALSSDKVRSQLEGKAVRRVIYVPGKLVNLVVG